MNASPATVSEARSGPGPRGSYAPNSATTPTADQYRAFSRMFSFFNERLFEGALPNVMLTFSRHPRFWGFFSPRRWSVRGDDEKTLGEIALNPDHLREHDARFIASTIAHEMAHCWQYAFGKPSRRNYHNKEWGAKMKGIGLMPSNTGAPGGRQTGQGMSHYVIEGGPFALAFSEMPAEWMLPFLSGAPPKKPRPSDPSKVKYDCTTCGIAAWGRTGLRLECIDCGTEMLASSKASGQKEVTT